MADDKTPKSAAEVGTPWPSPDEYTLAQRCPTCKADPLQPCTIRRRRMGDATFHAARMDRGIAHRNRDIAAAPWPEDREPGKSYDTIAAVLARYDDEKAKGRPLPRARASQAARDALKAQEAAERWPGEPCGLDRCPRQGDLWLCHDRPALLRHPDGQYCELGRQLFETGKEWWDPGTPG